MSEYGGDDLTVAEAAESAAKGPEATADQAFANKLAMQSPPNEVERAEIERARKRTKARAPRIVVKIENRGAGPRTYPIHSDLEGHRYRLADTFGTRSLQFVDSMLKGLGKATEDHSVNYEFAPGIADQLAFNAALAVIDGVRPKDEIEAMLAAHMALTNIALLELFARTRGAIAGHVYQGNGIKRLDVLGNLTTKFMRAYTMQVEALARKRRKGEQTVTVKHVHVHAGGQAVVGIVTNRGGRGVTKNDQQAYECGREKSGNPCNFTMPVSAEREPRAGSLAGHQRRKKGAADCTAVQGVAAVLLASGMGNTVTESELRLRLRSGRGSARC